MATLSWAGAHEMPHRFDVGLAQLAATFGLDVVELGTPWWPNLDNALLAIETTEEAMPPDALVRMLRPLGIDRRSRLLRPRSQSSDMS